LEQVERLELTAGEQQRDFIYIQDVVDAYGLLLHQGLSQGWTGFETYDVGSGKAITIRNLVEQIKQLTRSRTELQFGAVPYRAQEVMYAVADITPLQQLGWQPRYSPVEALQQTIAAIAPQLDIQLGMGRLANNFYSSEEMR
jgi:nucleoside-diphosphate-sugar epimerase